MQNYGDNRQAPSAKPNYSYAMHLVTEECEMVGGIGTGSYDLPPMFEELGCDRQRQVAEIIAVKGLRVVRAAGLDEFVHKHNIPVTGVERTIQAEQ